MSCFTPAKEDMARGAYVLRDAHMGLCDAIVAFEGDDMELLKAAVMLSVQGIALRLVRVTDAGLFMGQDEEYRTGVLKPGVPLVAVTLAGWPRELGAVATLFPAAAVDLVGRIKSALAGETGMQP